MYKHEMTKRKMGARIGLESRHEGIERILGSKRGGRGGARRNTAASARARTGARPARNIQQEQPPAVAAGRDDSDDSNDSNDDDSESEQEEVVNNKVNNNEATSDTSLEESDLESDDSSSSSSTDYSDWGANNLTPPQRTARKSGRTTGSSKQASSQDEAESDDDGGAAVAASSSAAVTASSSKPTVSSGKPRPERTVKRKKNYNFNPTQLDEIPPEYLPSDWLAQYIPNKSPYFPQMGDEVMYIKQGHHAYIRLVRDRGSYKLNMKEQQCLRRDDINNIELVKVIGMKHEIRPPRLCCLKLAIVDPKDNKLTGENFSIKYHDMNDVVDFLVLRHNYEASIKVKWKPGDRYRCQIEDEWWFGTVLEITPFDPALPDSPFLSVRCSWDSGEEERLSPWDMDFVHPGDTGYEKNKESVSVTREEIERFLYIPTPEEWRGLDSRIENKRISAGLEQVMALAIAALAIAEPYNYPVDLQVYPDYMLEIEYPMDFNLIKSRLDNQFYRRITAAQFDVRYMATNAEQYNRPKTDIVKNARILTDLVLKIIQDQELTDINGEYHRLVENFNWEDTQEAKPGKTGAAASGERRKAGRPAGRSRNKSGNSCENDSPINPKQWKHDCNDLLKRMFKHEDSEPFREPVSVIDFPDYSRFITTPMDLSSVQETLRVGEYKTPMEFKEEMDLIFANSFKYNTNKKAPVVAMTKRLKEYFLDSFYVIKKDWSKMNRRLTIMKKKGISPHTTPSKQTPQKRRPRPKDDMSDFIATDSDPGEGPSRPRARKKSKAVRYEESSTEDEMTEETTTEEEIDRPARSGRKRKKVVFDDDEDSEDEAPRGNRGRRNLHLSDEEPETRRKDKKGKGVSTKALSRKRPEAAAAAGSSSAQEQQRETTASEDGAEMVERGEKMKNSRNKSLAVAPPSDLSLEISQEDSDSEDVPISQRREAATKHRAAANPKSGRKAKKKLKHVPEPESDYEEEEEEITEEFEDETETEEEEEFISDEEDYEPNRWRRSAAAAPKNRRNSGRRRRSSEGGSRRNRKRKRESESHHAPRPRRQATARALSRFNESVSDEYLSEEEPRRNKRAKRNRQDIQPEPEAPEPPPVPLRRAPRGGTSSASREVASAPVGGETVTISAADSSTDPRNRRSGGGAATAATAATESDEEQQQLSSRGRGRYAAGDSSAAKSPRKSARQERFSREEYHGGEQGVRNRHPRLDDYSNQELMIEASRRGGGSRRRYGEEESDQHQESGRAKRNKKAVRYAEDSIQDYRQDYGERSSSSRRRSTTRPNYLDQSFSGDEEPRIANTRRERNAAEPIGQPGDDGDSDREEARRRGRPRGGEQAPRGAPRTSRGAPPQQRQPPADQQDSGEESDFGRRKRSRRISHRSGTGNTPEGGRRPQRQAAATRAGYRDPDSDDEEIPSRRRARQTMNYREMDRGESEFSDEEQEMPGAGGSAGVSSRGRVRRPNRRLLD